MKQKPKCFHCGRTEAEHIKTEKDCNCDDYDGECECEPTVDPHCKGFLEDRGDETRNQVAMEIALGRIAMFETQLKTAESNIEYHRKTSSMLAEQLQKSQEKSAMLERFLLLLEGVVGVRLMSTHGAGSCASPPHTRNWGG